ncbi:TIR-NBS-LRR resistance protein, partial [Trifolium medium]|nr:TIR-NBS-LRR resistance protein [Trifolium medium]
DGSCVGAMTKVVQGFDEAVEVEAFGLIVAIEWAKALRHQAIVIELDNNIIVQTVHSGRYPRNYWGNLVRSGGDYLRENTHIVLQWVRRSGNKVAYFLARWAEAEPNKHWVDYLPPHIVGHIQKDMLPP